MFLWVMVFLACSLSFAQTTTVTASVEVIKDGETKPAAEQSNVVVWLTPLSDARPAQDGDPARQQFVLHQKNKTFTPHLLVLPVGAVVNFPNHDPVFHNVFSLYEGKRFDLGLYEAGSSRTLRFDRAGVSYIFCNIHPDMAAVVIALRTPYYGVSDRGGRIALRDVPPGRYTLNVWHEGATPETLKALQREITVSGEMHSLGTLRLNLPAVQAAAHKNKYGQDYPRPSPPSGLYEQR
jgi:plastocyanin